VPEPRPLNFYVPRLIDLVTDCATRRQRKLPTFSEVVVIEEQNGERLGSWQSVSQFEARFRQILDITKRGWVNANCERVEEDRFWIVVEYLTTDRGSPRTWTSDLISVNLSGPSLRCFESLPGAPKP
jgi:hypothetical protein